MATVRQHYVPIWYQNRFTFDSERGRLLYVFDKGNPEDNPKSLPPINVGIERHIYSLREPGDSLEDPITTFENLAQPVIQRWVGSVEQPNDDEIMVMSFFVGLMLGRTPRMINASAEIQNAMVIATFRKLRNDPSEQARTFHALKGEGKLPGIDSLEELKVLISSFEDYISEGRIRIIPDRKYAMAESVKTGLDLAELLMDMRWCLLVAPSDAFFITSDCPVNLVFFPEERKVAFGGGLIHPTAQVSFPLSPQVSILIDHKANQFRCRVSKRAVDELNRRQVAKSERFIYSHLSDKTVADLVRKFSITRNRPKVDQEVFIQRFME